MPGMPYGDKRRGSTMPGMGGDIPLHLRRGSMGPGSYRRGSELQDLVSFRRGSMMPGLQNSLMRYGNRNRSDSYPFYLTGARRGSMRPGFHNQMDDSPTYWSSEYFTRYGFELENTFKMKPDQKFEPTKVSEIIYNSMKDFLREAEYEPMVMGQKATKLSDIIKEKIKVLKYDRYKIISWVSIVEKGRADLRVASRGLWDTNVDSYAEAVYQNKSIHAIGIVFAVYQE